MIVRSAGDEPSMQRSMQLLVVKLGSSNNALWALLRQSTDSATMQDAKIQLTLIV